MPTLDNHRRVGITDAADLANTIDGTMRLPEGERHVKSRKL